MDTFSLFVLGIFVLSVLMLYILAQLLRSLIRKQIDDQIKKIIPLKALRKRVGIKIKWIK
tara:strand:+ start:384 stop:563 length:180 start_codon:yes stop_codon:yes gene_type:complete